MEPAHFTLSKKPRSIFKNRIFVTIAQFVVICAIVIAVTSYNDALYSRKLSGTLFFALIFGIVAYIKIRQQKHFKEFDITDKGILAGGKIYLWQETKYYSWYGEKQGDRVGLIKIPVLGYDPINPYKFTDTQIVKVRLKRFLPPRYLGLGIDSDQREILTKLFDQHGLKHISRIQIIVGV